MFTFLLIVQAVVAAVLVTLVLMQRSEGGALGVGGSSSGLMTARGQADFLTRATAITAVVFVVMCILLAGLATTQHSSRSTIDVDASQTAPANPAAPTGGQPAQPAPAAPDQAPAQEPTDNDVLSTITGQSDDDRQ